MPAIDTRPEPRPLTLTTGVWPIRPQVLARGGVIDCPASSSKKIQAPRSSNRQYLWISSFSVSRRSEPGESCDRPQFSVE
ncbi:hypothetical protein ACH4Y0_40135, partial [Streptomyces sp. NPDC020707]|uniref:hypothetical protein n=1 Tax=Streptomyces sp. NPDC020707 TaxID=3365084 RepID=UPI0037934227